jgi:ABC-type multidrug transport system ATPase subunit
LEERRITIMINMNVVNVSKYYGKKKALDDFSYHIAAGNCLGIVGRNGAGKTTLMKILVGLMEKSSGEIAVGYDGRRNECFDPKTAYFIPETPVLPWQFRIFEFLGFVASLNASLGVETNRELREQLLVDFHLSGELRLKISELSKGMKRKVELIAALSSAVPVIVADEIDSGLDVPTKRQIESIISNFIATGRKNFIVSSHDVSFIGNVSEEVIVVDQGQCLGAVRKNGLRFEEFNDKICSLFAADDETGKSEC